MENLEKAYQKFLSDLTYPFEFHNIDYIGISLDMHADPFCRFKIYWSDHCSVDKDHWITEWLKEGKMAQYIETVEHSGRTGRYQTDIRLQRRTDENMEKLFTVLKERECIFSENESLIRKISGMPITRTSGYQYASLYFLGMIFQEKEQCEMLKLHWINRLCKNTDRLYGDIDYDDAHFLNYLRGLGITPYQKLADLSETTVRQCRCHLWMTGLDLAEGGWKKYKIYIKYPKDIYTALEECFSREEDDCRVMAEKAQILEKWIQMHPELVIDGAAFCTDTNGQNSVNLYYGIQESYFENGRTSYMD